MSVKPYIISTLLTNAELKKTTIFPTIADQKFSIYDENPGVIEHTSDYDFVHE